MRIFPTLPTCLMALMSGIIIAAGIDHGVWPITVFGIIVLLASMVFAYLEWRNDFYDQDEYSEEDSK